jgi:predicted site-specific integrase-resolvase
MSNKEDFYTVAEASDALGKSVPTIYRWMKLSRLRTEKNPVTHRLMVYKEDVSGLQKWI